MPVVLAIPVVIEGVAIGGAWAYRGYQAYRAYRAAKALEAIITAQNAAKAEEEAKEKAKTDAQAKADAAASSKCKDCDEDPDCQTGRDKHNESLYGIKGDTNPNRRGLAERLCHWLHGSDDKLRKSHLEELGNAANGVKKAREWLVDGGDRPYGRKEGARMSQKEKGLKLKNCSESPETLKDSRELEKLARDISEGRPSIEPMPRGPEFAADCAKDALGLVNKAFGR